MANIISLAVLGWVFALILAIILVAVLFYYLAKMNPNTCKSACMENCRTCRRNCKSHDWAITIDERLGNKKEEEL